MLGLGSQYETITHWECMSGKRGMLRFDTERQFRLLEPIARFTVSLRDRGGPERASRLGTQFAHHGHFEVVSY